MKSDFLNSPHPSGENGENAEQLIKAIGFKYELVAQGQAHGCFVFEGKRVDFSVGNSTNPLGDLLKGMLNLITEPSHIWGEDNISTVDWLMDTGCLRLEMATKDGLLLDFALLQYLDLFDESSGSRVMQGSLRMTEFYGAIIQELDRFIKKKGLLNYEQQWQSDEFPLTYFLFLKKFLIEKGCWIPTNVKFRNLADEIDFLMA